MPPLSLVPAPCMVIKLRGLASARGLSAVGYASFTKLIGRWNKLSAIYVLCVNFTKLIEKWNKLTELGLGEGVDERWG